MGKTPKKSTENYLGAIIHKDYLEELGDERCVQIVTKCGATQVARAIVDTTLNENATLNSCAQNWWIKWATEVFRTTIEERFSSTQKTESKADGGPPSPRPLKPKPPHHPPPLPLPQKGTKHPNDKTSHARPAASACQHQRTCPIGEPVHQGFKGEKRQKPNKARRKQANKKAGHRMGKRSPRTSHSPSASGGARRRKVQDGEGAVRRVQAILLLPRVEAEERAGSVRRDRPSPSFTSEVYCGSPSLSHTADRGRKRPRWERQLSDESS